MPTKLQTYVQMAEQTAAKLTRSVGDWTNFLAIAGRFYKYPFYHQLMIFAQRPQSTAVAPFKVWTQEMRMYVKRNSKGIALIDTYNNAQPRILYVFDVSDVGRKKDSTKLYLWQYREEYRDAITTALEKHFGIACNDGISQQLEDIGTKLITNFWDDRFHQIMYEIPGSTLDGMDEFNVGTEFKSIASTSISYVLLSRCGLHPEKYFRLEDFQYLCDFNTTKLIQILGTAVSQASGQVLSLIAKAIFDY